MLEPLGDDPEGESLNPLERALLRLAVGKDAGQFDHLGQPPAVLLLLDLHLEGDQQFTTSGQRVYDGGAKRPDQSESR